jgi:hypothetical protein
MQPVSGTFELRWQWYRGDDGAPDARAPRREPSAVSLDGAAPARPEPALAVRWPRLDEVRAGR